MELTPPLHIAKLGFRASAQYFVRQLQPSPSANPALSPYFF
jgi:hypothetical protein